MNNQLGSIFRPDKEGAKKEKREEGENQYEIASVLLIVLVGKLSGALT
jgi:hypothetical protein